MKDIIISLSILLLLCLCVANATKINVRGPNVMAPEMCYQSCGWNAPITQWTLGAENAGGSRINLIEGRAGAGVDLLGPIHFDDLTVTGSEGDQSGGSPVSWAVPAEDYIIGFTYEGWGNMPKNFKFLTQNGVQSPGWGAYISTAGWTPYSDNAFPGRSGEPIVGFWGSYCWCNQYRFMHSINAIVQMDDVCTDNNPCGGGSCTMTYNGPECIDLCPGVTCESTSCTNGQCVPATGSCNYTPLPNGTACDVNGAYAQCMNGVCQQDLDLEYDCDGGFGVNTASGCSCKSGFSGSNCEIRPSALCSPAYEQVQQNQNNFQTSVTASFSNNHYSVYVFGNLEENSFLNPADGDQPNSLPISLETEIQFGSGSNPCNYPGNSAWEKSGPTDSFCQDVYFNEFTWDQARDSCGFSAPEGSRTFQQTIRVARRYKISEIAAGESIYRTESSARLLTITFPNVGVVNTGDSSIQISNPVAPAVSLTTALSLADYDPYSTLWTVQITSLSPTPFKLLSISTVSSGGDLDSYGRLSSYSLADVAACINGDYCRQIVTLQFARGSLDDNCVALNGNVNLMLQLGCNEDSQEPCNYDPQPVNMSVILHTSDACPVSTQITFSQSSLSVFSDAGAENPASSFIWNQVAYFGVILESSDAEIISRSVDKICAFSTGGGCLPLTFTQLAPANGYDPIFSVDLSDNRNYLEYIQNNLGPIRIQAAVVVGFAGVDRSNVFPTQNVNVEATFTYKTTPINGGSMVVASTFLIMTLIAILL